MPCSIITCVLIVVCPVTQSTKPTSLKLNLKMLEVNLLLNVHTPSTHVHFLQGVKVCGAAVFPQRPERAGGHRTSDLRALLGLQKGSLKLTSLKIMTVFEIS